MRGGWGQRGEGSVQRGRERSAREGEGGARRVDREEMILVDGRMFGVLSVLVRKNYEKWKG